MSIPVSAMHEDIRDAFLGVAERQIEASDDYQHPVAGRDAVRLAYILFEEAGNSNLWEEAQSNYRDSQ
tara:strand:+ start:157 stop:360 length:204 start_codon:yes stop_codon:yes gene_type:complete